MAAPADVVVDSTDVNSSASPFVLPAQPQEVNEALEDFRRYAKRGTWEKAFKSLQTMVSKANEGLIARRDGMAVPAPVLWRSLLAELPGDGKKAYRLFHDAEAKALLDAAQGKDELAKLQQIVNSHLVTSVGDVAANRLGDLYFEQGLMDRAVEAWQMILTALPDSSLSRADLLTKTGIALARAGRWEELRLVQQELADKHARDFVVLGGKRVAPAEHLAGLARLATPTPSASQPDLVLPDVDDAAPLWQFRLSQKRDAVVVNPRMGWNGDEFGRMALSEMVLPVDFDDERLYTSLMGCNMALDIKSGKLLWRSGRFHDVQQKIRQNAYYIFPERYQIAVDSTRIWSVGRTADHVANHGSLFYLVGRDKKTGKELFNSKSVKDVQTWSIIGKPLPAGDVVYACGYKQGQGTQIHALAINVQDKKLVWSRQLGTAKVDPDQNYYQRVVMPALALHEDKLFVETHQGALVALGTADGKIAWAVSYRCTMPQNYYGQRPYATASTPQLAGGVLYSKGMYGEDVLAVVPSGPRLLWRRSVLPTALVAGVDGDRLYMAGEVQPDGSHLLIAYDLKQLERQAPKLAWSAKVPPSTPWLGVAATRSRLYQFTPRGIYEFDKRSGQNLRNGDAEAYRRVNHPFRGADSDNDGGAVIVTPAALITSSNMTITAYPLRTAPGPAAVSAATAGGR